MPGRNTANTPNTADYNLGRGKVYLSGINPSTGKPDGNGFRDVGNVPEFTLTVDSETLEHQSSQQALRLTDKEVVLETSLTVAFTFDEINHENLSDFLLGDTADYVNPSIAGFTKHEMIAAVKPGKWYQIVNSAGARAYDVAAGSLTVNNGSDEVLLVLGEDYELKQVEGLIRVLASSARIAADDPVDVTVGARAGAATIHEVRGLTKSSTTVALMFVAENPAANDAKREYMFHQIELKPDGDLALIGDEWTQGSLTGKAERNLLADSNAPTMRVRDFIIA